MAISNLLHTSATHIGRTAWLARKHPSVVSLAVEHRYLAESVAHLKKSFTSAGGRYGHAAVILATGWVRGCIEEVQI